MRASSSRAKEIHEAMFPNGASLEAITEGVLFISRNKIRVEASDAIFESWKRVDGFLLRKDPPHFQGDEYHVHAPLQKGCEASWGVSGMRRHPNKFPARVPAGLGAAAAKVLNVPQAFLEMSWIVENDERTLLIEVRNTSD